MSVSLNRVGGLEPPESQLLTTTNATTIISASTAYGRTVEQVILSNINGTDRIVLLEWVDSTPTSYKYWRDTVPANDTVIVEIPILLQGNGKVRSIKATAANANDIWVTVISSAQTKQAPA